MPETVISTKVAMSENHHARLLDEPQGFSEQNLHDPSVMKSDGEMEEGQPQKGGKRTKETLGEPGGYSDSTVYFNFPLKDFCRQNRPLVAEFWGTFFLVTFGCGSLASLVLNRGVDSGKYFSITVGWGIGLALALCVSGAASGGHLNPAVTFAMAMFNKFEWAKVPKYMCAQFLGAFAASICIFAVYSSALYQHDGGIRAVTGYNATAGLFATYPAPFVTLPVAFLNEMLGTALLLFVICAFTDKDNDPAGRWTPLTVGFLLLSIGTSLGWQTGFALNPARDLAPRIFTMLGGWGFDVFMNPPGYWWVPLTAPFVGAVLGVACYEYFISQRL